SLVVLPGSQCARRSTPLTSQTPGHLESAVVVYERPEGSLKEMTTASSSMRSVKGTRERRIAVVEPTMDPVGVAPQAARGAPRATGQPLEADPSRRKRR